MRFALILGILFSCLSCTSEKAGSNPVKTSQQATILARYHVVTWSVSKQAMVGLVRAVTPIAQQKAPDFQVNGTPQVATARANPDTTAFPVNVWEWQVAIGDIPTLEGKHLPAISTKPEDIVVLGDTGAYSNQDTSSAEWPFGQMITTLSQANRLPDLVVHVGDYNYRGTPHHSPHQDSPDVYDACGSDFQHQDTQGMAWGDNWKTWKADFFDPAQPMLDKVPWVLARGNHELCSRAGTGWFFLLDPGSSLLDANYSSTPCANANTFTSPAYALAFQNLQLIMVDSANLCDTSIDQTQVATYTPVFQAALASAQQRTNLPSWMVTHRPLYSYHKVITEDVAQNAPEMSTYYCKTMDAVLTQTTFQNWNSAFPIWLCGHVHNFQFIKPTTSGWPTHFVVGNSGVSLSDPGVNGPVRGTFNLTSGELDATGSTYKAFGYLRMKQGPSAQWQATLHSPDGTPIDQFTP